MNVFSNEENETDLESLMWRAIELAQQANGDTHPNPMVGALIVEEGKIVAEGWHARAGTPHAERNALVSLGRRPKRGATLFVTLEPCSTQGRTGACTEAIIAAGISCVVAGATDPNPAHAGRGFRVLREAGIKVVSGVLAEACSRLNPIFNHTIVAGTPLLAAKTATTLDGRTATRTGESQWITNAEARADVMRLRRYFPAIATGAGTVLADDPSLTSRPAGRKPAFCPTRFVFDRRLRTLSKLDSLRIFNDEFCEKTVLVTVSDSVIPAEAQATLSRRGIAVWAFPREENAFWRAFRERCAKAQLAGVLFEAGADLLGGLLAARQADYLYAYFAPKIFGDPLARPAFAGTPLLNLASAQRVEAPYFSRFGDNFLVEGKFSRET